MTTNWWRDAVIYQVYIRSLADGSGDGVGDIAGIRSRLPHFADLGVDALWITPWYPSPMADGGYDVADYRDIDPLFGSLDDAQRLIEEAHDAGLRVIIDLVPNHTSDQHPWFKDALSGHRRDRYVFREGRDGGPPNDWRSVFGGPAWTRVDDGTWYLHLFAPEQPDLNWDHPEVRAEFESIIRWWLDRGVDGFRIDVAHGLVKDPALPDLGADREDIAEPPRRADHPHWDREGVHEVYRSWRAISDSYAGERVFVAEAWVAKPERLANYVRPGELHTAFNFDFLRCSWHAGRLRAVIDSSLHALGAVGAPATWVLSNHDVVRHVTRYGRAQHTGPRHDPDEPVDLAVGLRRARAAVLLMLALPGSAYLYQGEELGLWEVEDLPVSVLQDPTWQRSGHTVRGRDGCRVPLPWSGDEPPFGFGGGGAWLPQPAEWAMLTAQSQKDDPGSMLNLYREALRIRRAHEAFGDGTMTWLDSPEGVLVFARDPGVICVVNLSADNFPIPDHRGVLLSSVPISGTVPPDAAVWLTV
ncbi:alpha-glucosidase [Lentzea sp. NBRC 105346]|uniref:glycoside hydrolase family 13 protein n=1 Tax=Lentzea sp. NBRC 105346 TaxID=3032205 RepID=UPI0024A1493E|nr:alpha-amylase family glycosyl hydrolase [Lentzea sp. NBRC 105346]GLZ28907.1 alpha-glucosidase [Lentzea sp. NBRC 105346]